MKNLFLVCLPLLFIQSTCKQKSIKTLQNTTIEYQESSRGVFRSITIQDNEITTTTIRGVQGDKSKLSDENLLELSELLNNIDLNQLEKLETSTHKASTDRSLFATLKVTKDSKIYQTQGFDHDNPPKEVSDLVKKIKSIANFY